MEIIIWLVVAGLCYKVAIDKNRNGVGWFIGGFFFSIIALFLLLLLPTLEGDKID